jgi:hypothetical protein
LCVDLLSCSGLNVDGSRGGLAGDFWFRIFNVHAFEEKLVSAPGPVRAELGGWGEEAVFGVERDLGDDLGGRLGGIGFGQVEAGDLETVEEQAGAAGVDVVGGDAAEDFADGLLDGRAVFRVREGEARLAAVAGGGVLDGAAGVVVEVAEGLATTIGAFGAADGGAAAAAAVGEDVAALEAGGFGLGCDGFRCHMAGTPSPGFLRKV